MKRTCEILAAVALILVAASAVYAGGPVACGHGTVTWSPDTLWPPNHTLHTINITYTQPCDDPAAPHGCAGGDFSVMVTNIASNEEPPGRGCGQPNPPQGPDYNGIGNSSTVAGTEPISVATTVQVRAERCGNGSGRVYTISVTCEEHGEAGFATLTVKVPHDVGH
jgi:hypothetical protein